LDPEVRFLPDEVQWEMHGPTLEQFLHCFLLNVGKLREALGVPKLNVQEYPESFNAWGCLLEPEGPGHRPLCR